jgi:hypothetical protein
VHVVAGTQEARLDGEPVGDVRAPRSSLVAVLAALLLAGCGGAKPHEGRTVTFSSAGAFPTATIVGSYSVRGCAADTRTLVGDALQYYRHSNGAPGPADLYYYDMRFSYAHFEADECTSEELGRALRSRLTARQRTFLLHNVARDLYQVFHGALDAANGL